jgi:hypothetical protein
MKKIFLSLILVFSSFISFSQEKGIDQKIDEALHSEDKVVDNEE